jgi:hypothetical protein
MLVEGNFIAKCRTFLNMVADRQFFRPQDDVSFRTFDCKLPFTRNYNYFPIKLYDNFQIKTVKVFSSLKKNAKMISYIQAVRNLHGRNGALVPRGELILFFTEVGWGICRVMN